MSEADYADLVTAAHQHLLASRARTGPAFGQALAHLTVFGRDLQPGFCPLLLILPAEGSSVGALP
jgi:hypothetical protein